MQKTSWSKKVKEFHWPAASAFISATSVLIAIASLIFTTYQSALTRQVTRIGTQAWVGVVGARHDFKIGEAPKVTILLKNTGKSPASDVRVYSVDKVADKSVAFTQQPEIVAEMQKEVDQLFARSPHRFFNMGTIAQDQTPFYVIDFFPEADLDAVRRGDRVLFIAGKFLYSDVFGQSHETHFCYWSPPGESGDMRFCGAENTMN